MTVSKPFSKLFFLSACLVLCLSASMGQGLKDLKATGQLETIVNPVEHNEQFNGYTKYWFDSYTQWTRYGNLFKTAVPDIRKTILQSKLDIAEDIGIPGLLMQEGFITNLISSEYKTLNNPSRDQLEQGIKSGNILVLTDPDSEIGKELDKLIEGNDSWPYDLKSHQYKSENLKLVKANYLKNGSNLLFNVSSKDRDQAERLLEIIDETKEVLDTYTLSKGWFGAKSLLKSVTCTPGHPLEIIGKGMNEGVSWFVFDGYMDILAQDELDQWMKDVDLPVVADVGFSPIYGCSDYEELQVQDMETKEAWYKYAQSKGGYVFKPVYEPEWDGFLFDGYVAIDGNKEQIDQENVPFIAETGHLADNLTTSMVLFIEKSKALTKENIWDAIMDRRAVAVLEKANMFGQDKFRRALELLYLDRIFLEDYYGDRLDLQTFTEGNDLKISIRNLSQAAVKGTLEIKLPEGVTIETPLNTNINLPAGGYKQLSIQLLPSAKAMGYTNPIAVHFNSDKMNKSSLAMLDLPPAISLNKILYCTESDPVYPVSVHNYSKETTFPVKLEVFLMEGRKRPITTITEIVECNTGSYVQIPFDLQIKEGLYRVEVSALGTTAEGQLGVEKDAGSCYLYEDDLDSDGIMEYRMENDSVMVTLLSTGARVIEYIVKSRSDNVLFKIWPEKPIDDNRPFRKRGFYPYGGFEDFLGQASMETHQVYDAVIEKKEGEYVRVLMSTDYFGNKLKKIFTLYGNSPLLEVRYELDFINPEANVLGPQPILELGEVHGTEDVFTVLTNDGLKEYRMRPEEYYGNLIYPKEGWNAGYDTKEDIAFVGAFPVDQPLFLHLWMNHPVNKDSHHYYVEFQPWTPIIQRNTMYFTYYLWGSGGAWENGVEELRKRNLVSVSKNN